MLIWYVISIRDSGKPPNRSIAIRADAIPPPTRGAAGRFRRDRRLAVSQPVVIISNAAVAASSQNQSIPERNEERQVMAEIKATSGRLLSSDLLEGMWRKPTRRFHYGARIKVSPPSIPKLWCAKFSR